MGTKASLVDNSCCVPIIGGAESSSQRESCSRESFEAYDAPCIRLVWMQVPLNSALTLSCSVSQVPRSLDVSGSREGGVVRSFQCCALQRANSFCPTFCGKRFIFPLCVVLPACLFASWVEVSLPFSAVSEMLLICCRYPQIHVSSSVHCLMEEAQMPVLSTEELQIRVLTFEVGNMDGLEQRSD